MNDPVFLALAAIFLLVGIVIATHPKVYRSLLGDQEYRRYRDYRRAVRRTVRWRQRI